MSDQPKVPPNLPEPFRRWHSTGERLWSDFNIGEYACACACQHCWLEIANALMKKCSDEGRVHFRYGIEDEPECKEYEEAHWQAAGWAVIAKHLEEHKP